jgi:hypothetical protein
MLNVFVKQLQFVSLLTYFNPEQIAHREHSYPAISIDNRKMPGANQLQSFEGLMGCFVALDHGAQLTRHFSYPDGFRIAMCNDYAIQDVTLRKDSDESPVFVDHANCAYVPRRHEFCRFLHGGRRFGRVRLTVANHVPDQHRICLLILSLWGASIIKNETPAVSIKLFSVSRETPS